MTPLRIAVLGGSTTNELVDLGYQLLVNGIRLTAVLVGVYLLARSDERPSDIGNWFTALHQALAGTSSALWDDPDLFSAANHGGPMAPAQLQANLKAAYGQVSTYSGFSFTTQLDPNLTGSSSYYNAYLAYERKQS